jgi:hypothetical protein
MADMQMIANPKVNFVAFTGSVEGGRAVYKTVANSRFIDGEVSLLYQNTIDRKGNAFKDM